jgi:hypothetical protein
MPANLPNGYIGNSMRQRAKRAQSVTGAREARPQKRKLRAKHDPSRARTNKHTAMIEESSKTARD